MLPSCTYPSSRPASDHLAAPTHPPQSWDRINPADAAAACFYATNPRNSFRNNAASGGWTGYSFPRLEAPMGMFRWRKDLVGAGVRRLLQGGC
jgi:hypothetical protein